MDCLGPTNTIFRLERLILMGVSWKKEGGPPVDNFERRGRNQENQGSSARPVLSDELLTVLIAADRDTQSQPQQLRDQLAAYFQESKRLTSR